MIGSPARAEEAPGRVIIGAWRRQSSLASALNCVGTTGTCEQILRGPAQLDDGTHNLWEPLKRAWYLNKDMKEMQQASCDSPLTEGKVYQKHSRLAWVNRFTYII